LLFALCNFDCGEALARLTLRGFPISVSSSPFSMARARHGELDYNFGSNFPG
jgi:hypothetical protein